MLKQSDNKWDKNSSVIVTIVAFAVFPYLYLTVLYSHTKLVEDRGVYDDICYLRQAYLFRSLGVVGGLDTDNPSARYAASLIKNMGLERKLSSNIPCHGYLAATGKLSMQYPPGTGFFLSAFPEGVQASGLYIVSSTTIFLMLMWLIATARVPLAVGLYAGFGALTLYLMVNPAKASYSIAPTMPLCIAVAYLTVQMFAERAFVVRVLIAASAGLLLGIATDIRLSSVLLAFGYMIGFALQFLRTRTWATFVHPLVFGLALIVGTIPTLAANVINGGGPFTTAYGGADTAPPLTSVEPLLAQIRWYLFSGTHSVLTWLSILLFVPLAMVAIKRKLLPLQLPLLIACITLVSNDLYFIMHPIQSQYYSVPPAILALWIGVMVFAALLEREEAPPFKPSPRSTAGVVGATLVIATMVLTYGGIFSRPQFVPGVAIESNAVVWIGGDNWMDAWKRSGLGLTFQYRYQRHTISGLGTLPVMDQDKTMAAVVTDARPQYIVVDDQGTREVIARLTNSGRTSIVGQAFGADIYRIEQ